MVFIDHLAIGVLLILNLMNMFKLNDLKEKLDSHREWLEIRLINMENSIKEDK